MPRVVCFDVPGCDLRFYSDDHRPAHFHARVPGEFEIRVFFLREPPEYQEVWVVTRIPSGVLRTILDEAAVHRVELFEEWSEKVAPGE